MCSPSAGWRTPPCGAAIDHIKEQYAVGLRAIRRSQNLDVGHVLDGTPIRICGQYSALGEARVVVKAASRLARITTVPRTC
jgi:hypothetical protein